MNTEKHARDAISLLRNIALLLGVVCGIIAAAAAFSGVREFYPAYLFGYIFWLGISLGCTFMLMLHYLTGGAWGKLTRRIFEAAAGSLPLLIILFIPVVLGMKDLYVWTRPDYVRPHELDHQARYLNPPFFIARAFAFFTIWAFFSYYYRSLSLKQDMTRDPGPTVRLERFSAFGMILLIFTVSFAYIDWLMSMEPEWFSSVYPVMVFSGQIMAAVAFTLLFVSILMKDSQTGNAFTPARIQDLGTILFALVFFSAYLGYSQMIILWAGNMKTEITWYLIRIAGAWQFIVWAIFLFHFILPFFFLLFRSVKRNILKLRNIALVALVAEVLNTFWLISPEYHHSGPEFHWIYVVTFLGIGGLWLSVFTGLLMNSPFLPLHGIPQLETAEIARMESA